MTAEPLLSYYLRALYSKNRSCNIAIDSKRIGSGSAGSVLASRLSENSAKSVLLLEAGPDHYWKWYSHIPGLFPYLQLTDIDWQYQTVPQQNACLSMNDNQCQWARGKCLGGSSVLNAMQYTRGNKADYNRWAEIVNDDRFAYMNVLKYFKKSETAPNKSSFDKEFHGHDGPLTITLASAYFEISRIFMRAAAAMGYPINKDYNGENQEGFSYVQRTVRNGKRCSVAFCYLEPAMQSRNNLHVVTHAHVRRIVVDRTTKRATAVEVVDTNNNNKLHRISSKAEIIVSAGAIGSPQLLLLSGLGPSDHLNQLKIKPIVDLKNVGENLIDHVGTDLSFCFNRSVLGLPSKAFSLSSVASLFKAILDYSTFSTGLLSMPGYEVSGFFKSGHNFDNEDWPDLHFYIDATLLLDSKERSNMKDQDFNASYAEAIAKNGITLISSLLHPHSVGTLRLKSADFTDYPLLDPQYLSDERDVNVLVAGLKMLSSIMQNSTEMQSIGSYLCESPLPACLHSGTFMSDDYLNCLVRHRTYTIWHMAGTCRMGHNENDSVVDSQFRVHGVKGLRVVDASVFPIQISGNPNAPIVMLAELASDLMKNLK